MAVQPTPTNRPKNQGRVTFGTGLEALKAGDVDLTLSDSTPANGCVYASTGGLQIIGEPLASEDFCFIVPKGQILWPDECPIASMRGDGTLDALNQKWFVDYRFEYSPLAARRHA